MEIFMSKTAVIYWSGTGNTKAMAEAIFAGAKAADAQNGIFEVSEISAEKALEFDNLILGCPAMGDEVLEEGEFEPFFESIEGGLSGKNVALFGSYGWGDGEWMRNWEERVIGAGAKLVGGEGLIVNDAPDADAEANCTQLGSTVAAL